jgi:hypothetical protein
MAMGNTFMDMISKGISNTKPEGVMTARNERIMQLDSLIDPDMDPGDLRTIYDEMMLNSGGKYPGGTFDDFLKLIGTRTASNDEAVRQLENLFEMFKEQGMSDEEAEKAARERMESAAVRKAADGGIMYLAPGGSTDDVPLKKTIKTPSTYTGRAFEDFLMDAGFTKKDEKTGKIRGAKGMWNSFLLKQGIVPGSDDATDALNKILKSKGKQLYISTNMAQGKFGLPLVEEITGTVKGQQGAALRDNTFQQLEEIRLDANDKHGKNPTKKKYDYIEKEVIKKFPKVAGTTVLSNFITGKALGAIGAFMPSELEAGTIYSPEDMDKILGEMKIREKFK